MPLRKINKGTKNELRSKRDPHANNQDEITEEKHMIIT